MKTVRPWKSGLGRVALEERPWKSAAQTGISAAVENEVMHVRIRKSNVKRDKRGFRYRMKTRAGRKLIRDRRRIGRKLPGYKKLMR